MSFTSFSLNSLHVGSIFYILELQVSDGGDGRHTTQMGSPSKKGCAIQRASTVGCGSLCNQRQIQVILCYWELKWDVWECVWRLCCTYLNNSYEVWEKKFKTMHLNVSFTWIFKNFSFCLEGALNWYQINKSIIEVNWVLKQN